MKVLLKFSVITALALNTVNVFANDHMQDHPDFSKHKQEKIDELEGRISLLQQDKSCLASAANPEDMKKCHEASEAREKELRAKHEAMRSQHIEEQIKRLQEEKEKIGQHKK